MSITHQLKDFLTASTEHGDGGDDARTREEACLFRCADCDVTYVSTEMDACANCGTTVESVPTARDLGML